MDIWWAHITNLFSWPPGWETLFALAVGAVAGLARIGWRAFAVLVLLAALFYFPPVLLGPLLGLVSLKGDTITLLIAGSQLGVWHGYVEAGAFLAAALAVIVWKNKFAPEQLETSEAKRLAELRQAQWTLLYGLCQIVLAPLSLVVHFATIFGTGAGVPAMVATMFTPVIAQLYWTVAIFADTGSLDHPVTKLFALWVVVFALFMLARRKAGIGRTTVTAPLAPAPVKPPVWPRRPAAKGL